MYVGHLVIPEGGGKDHPWVHSEFEVTLEYMSRLSKRKKKEKTKTRETSNRVSFTRLRILNEKIGSIWYLSGRI